jgi:hypothetical protein
MAPTPKVTMYCQLLLVVVDTAALVSVLGALVVSASRSLSLMGLLVGLLEDGVFVGAGDGASVGVRVGEPGTAQQTFSSGAMTLAHSVSVANGA